MVLTIVFFIVYGSCATDGKFNRLLTGYFEAHADMTIEMCLSACRSHGFPYAGLEWKTECYCGHAPQDGFFDKWTWSSKCNLFCPGNGSQNCGGIGGMSIWSTPPSELQGLCVNDYPADGRVLAGFSMTGIDDLTIEKCQSICQTRGLGSTSLPLSSMITAEYMVLRKSPVF